MRFLLSALSLSIHIDSGRFAILVALANIFIGFQVLQVPSYVTVLFAVWVSLAFLAFVILQIIYTKKWAIKDKKGHFEMH